MDNHTLVSLSRDYLRIVTPRRPNLPRSSSSNFTGARLGARIPGVSSPGSLRRRSHDGTATGVLSDCEMGTEVGTRNRVATATCYAELVGCWRRSPLNGRPSIRSARLPLLSPRACHDVRTLRRAASSRMIRPARIVNKSQRVLKEAPHLDDQWTFAFRGFARAADRKRQLIGSERCPRVATAAAISAGKSSGRKWFPGTVGMSSSRAAHLGSQLS